MQQLAEAGGGMISSSYPQVICRLCVQPFVSSKRESLPRLVGPGDKLGVD
jgi:hypothetical protein